jgi:hypothetical protein
MAKAHRKPRWWSDLNEDREPYEDLFSKDMYPAYAI